MSDPVICVDRLSKKYRLRHAQQEPYKSLRDVLMNGARSLGRCLTHPKRRSPDPNHEDFWALQDVSFEVKQGDRVGIIGRNGAGKSTLLKILSRIVEPTAGRIRIRGRVASLLEVGTGFHPELTGRENIYLNGAILGMGRAEIKRKFDEIVAFAEVEKFLDTPVKRYSSGMYVRLAFAVAAHLEPEILVVDEVLAVGDAQFQKKCLGKMKDVSKEGRTVIFVSHQMATVASVCQKTIWLNSGQLHMEGNTEHVISKYLTYGAERSGDVFIPENSSNNTRFRFKRLTLLDPQKQITSVFDLRNPFIVRLEYELSQSINNLEISLRVYNSSGIPIFTTNRSSCFSSDFTAGNYVAEVEIPGNFLAPGVYSINIGAHIPKIEILSAHESIISFDVEETGSNMALYQGAAFGVVIVDCPWKETNSIKA